MGGLETRIPGRTPMPRSTPEQELAAAAKQLDEARKRLADSRRRRRDLTLDGNSLGDAIQKELWQAGRDGRDPEISGQRGRITEIQAELGDLDRLETGIEHAVTDAANEVAAVRFRFAPAFEGSSRPKPRNSPSNALNSSRRSPPSPRGRCPRWLADTRRGDPRPIDRRPVRGRRDRPGPEAERAPPRHHRLRPAGQLAQLVSRLRPRRADALRHT